MELGIFSRTYETANLEEVFLRMVRDGITHTQFNFSSIGLEPLPEKVSDEDLEMIRNLSQKYGITLDALTGTFNMIDPDLTERNKGIRQFAYQCRLAKELHIPLVTLCTGSKNRESKWKWDEDNLSQRAWDDLMETTAQILPYAEENNILLGVETEASNVINTPQRARKYLDLIGSDHLKIVMDGANLFVPENVSDAKEVLDEAFDLLGKDIVSAHAKDFSFDGSITFTAAGRGMLDFSYYLKKLKDASYAGSLIMHGLSEQQVPESCRYLRDLL